MFWRSGAILRQSPPASKQKGISEATFIVTFTFHFGPGKEALPGHTDAPTSPSRGRAEPIRASGKFWGKASSEQSSGRSLLYGNVNPPSDIDVQSSLFQAHRPALYLMSNFRASILGLILKPSRISSLLPSNCSSMRRGQLIPSCTLKFEKTQRFAAIPCDR